MFGGDRRGRERLENDLIELRREVLALRDGLVSLEGAQQAVTADSLLQWEKVNRALGRLAKRAEATATEHDGPTRGACKTVEEVNEIIRAGGDPWPIRS